MYVCMYVCVLAESPHWYRREIRQMLTFIITLSYPDAYHMIDHSINIIFSKLSTFSKTRNYIYINTQAQCVKIILIMIWLFIYHGFLFFQIAILSLKQRLTDER